MAEKNMIKGYENTKDRIQRKKNLYTEICGRDSGSDQKGTG